MTKEIHPLINKYYDDFYDIENKYDNHKFFYHGMRSDATNKYLFIEMVMKQLNIIQKQNTYEKYYYITNESYNDIAKFILQDRCNNMKSYKIPLSEKFINTSLGTCSIGVLYRRSGNFNDITNSPTVAPLWKKIDSRGYAHNYNYCTKTDINFDCELSSFSKCCVTFDCLKNVDYIDYINYINVIDTESLSNYLCNDNDGYGRNNYNAYCCKVVGEQNQFTISNMIKKLNNKYINNDIRDKLEKLFVEFDNENQNSCMIMVYGIEKSYVDKYCCLSAPDGINDKYFNDDIKHTKIINFNPNATYAKTFQYIDNINMDKYVEKINNLLLKN